MENKIIIEFAHICENVIVANNGNLSIVNIFNQISSSNFPAIHPVLFIVVGATGDEGEYEVNIQIKKEGDERPVTTQTLPDKMKIPKFPAQGRLFVKFSPLVLKFAGSYKIIISIAGQTKILFFEAKQVIKQP
ncbi:hypothetical protein A3C91_00370 [Candidatus Azambacteria bacterium RIFCSPHIGHO2_02_FULL_52_12]|uniref:Uncharacterized protein n=1 Tax=Candidatus Azambacteria bacterium RIFCSPLOWO2_01_FULL_46_25 TaxID=1797298 RepID=A0A1F5BTT3_9BACT|nr:MAG: hypothetical protein A3C91_00370 [Candidatus Azambacteria bacterium RIFCSPHIGHO2_02_FULL_52_12]OGD33988.1 MAG: hypothetical protein A2988_00685 [Candidatus Azambacteria bacterium RIFCSPLOWO2_01_FULL_46_25]